MSEQKAEDRRQKARGRAAVACCLLFAACCLPVFADVIYDLEGGTLRGLVVEEHWDRIVVSTEWGEQTILRETIEEIFFDEPERNQLYLGNQALGAGEFSLAQGFFRKALRLNPNFQEANDALGRLEDQEAKLAAQFDLTQPVPVLLNRIGMTVGLTDQFSQIRMIRADSPADRAGLSIGDLLISYWGESLGFLPVEEIARRILGPPRTAVTLTVQREVMLPSALPFERDWPAMQMGMSRSGLTVLEVTPKGMAALTGLRLGDRIVRLDKQPTRYMPLSKARRVMAEAKETGVTLVIQRDITLQR